MNLFTEDLSNYKTIYIGKKDYYAIIHLFPLRKGFLYYLFVSHFR
jgi:hypothetical protein